MDRESLLKTKEELESELDIVNALLDLSDEGLNKLNESLQEHVEKDSIGIPVWWKHGSMLTRRDCLPSSHPESTYSYIRNVLGKDPEDYGVYPDGQRCPECNAALPSYNNKWED